MGNTLLITAKEMAKGREELFKPLRATTVSSPLRP